MTAHTPRHMALTMVMLPPGCYKEAWRLPDSGSDRYGSLDIARYVARLSEEAKLDAIFIADVVTAATIYIKDLPHTGFNEPLTTLSALSSVTERIGLIGTVSTTFSLPFVTARQLASLDLLSEGRAGWNIVSSWIGHENFGLEAMPDPELRYRQASEFVEVACSLWDGWSDDAVVNDREGAVWVDTGRIKPVNFQGEYLSVAGPLNMPRSPQGRPVLFQAGQSEPGRDFAARVADVVYSAAPSKEHALEFYRDMKTRARAHGRNPDLVKIVPGITPIVGETDAEAEEIAQHLADHIDFAAARAALSAELALDLEGVGLDEVIPDERWSETAPPGIIGSRYAMYLGMSRQDRRTLRELIVERYRSDAHLWVTGSAETIADLMIDWFESGACDGFSFNPAFMTGSVERICRLLVPELQRRGYFREEYEGTTLREHLGLERPAAWDRR